MSVTAETGSCNICYKNSSRYVCPRCNIPYCSLSCYRSSKHAVCSESFYHDCVVEELASQKGKNNSESSHVMQEILLKHHQEGGESSHNDLDSDDSNDAAEEVDLGERLAGVDLDDAEAVWECLSAAERADFENVLRSGDVSCLLPVFKPWWERENKCLVQEVEEPEKTGIKSEGDSDLEKLGDGVCNIPQDPEVAPLPRVTIDIPTFTQICTKPASPCIPFNIANVIASYTYTTRCFNGEHQDWAPHAAHVVWGLSAALSQNHNFHTLTDAVMSVSVKAAEDGSANGDAVQLIHSDTHSILSSDQFVKAALSDLHTLFNAALHKQNCKRKGPFSQRFPNGADCKLSKASLKLAFKKIEFYLSWFNHHNFIFTSC